MSGQLMAHQFEDLSDSVCVDLLKIDDHKFYISTTNIEFNPATQNLEMVSRIFTDDLEELLRTRYNVNLKLDEAHNSERNEKLIKKYILNQWLIKNRNRVLELNYLGHQYDIDQIKIFIEASLISHPDSLFFENKTLFDFTSEQQNLIHVKVGDQRKSLLMFPENPNGVLNFD